MEPEIEARIRELDDSVLLAAVTTSSADYTDEAKRLILETLRERGYSEDNLTQTSSAGDRDENVRKAQPIPDNLPGFNLGACVLPPIWLAFHGRLGTALGLLVLSFSFRLLEELGPAMSLFALLANLAIAVYFGTQGNAIAWGHKRYQSIDDLKRGQRGWTVAGAIVGCLIFFWVALSLFA